jgi:hypothetical protein
MWVLEGGVDLRVVVPASEHSNWMTGTRGTVITEEDCIRALREAADHLGKSPTKAEFEELPFTPSSTSIIRIMGGWNDAKEAAKLETVPERMGGGPSIQPKPEWVELPDGYEWDELNPQQRWYYKNREHRVAVKTQRKEKLQKWFAEFKRRECTCEICGESHPACLDFHHVEEKRMGVSRMVHLGFAKDKILAEIESCRILCSNCHRKEHYGSEEPDD